MTEREDKFKIKFTQDLADTNLFPIPYTGWYEAISNRQPREALNVSGYSGV